MRYLLVLVAVLAVGSVGNAQSISGTITITGTVTSAQVQPRPNCPAPASLITIDTSTGDAGAAINAADSALGTGSGTIQVNGGGNIKTTIHVSSCHVLSFGPGTWTNSIGAAGGSCVAPFNASQCDTINFADRVTIQGAGPTQTIIQETPDACGGPSVCYHDTATAFVIHGPESAQGTDLILHDFQVSGVGIARAPNGAQSTIFTGLVNGQTLYNLSMIETHSIGLSLGGHTNNAAVHARNISLTNSTFLHVGGCPVTNHNCGGGVVVAVLEGSNITVANNTLYDARGLSLIDVEPESGTQDIIQNLVIDSNVIDHSGAHSTNPSTDLEWYIYAIVYHPNVTLAASGPPAIKITNNTILGGWYNDGSGKIQPTGYLSHSIATSYGPLGCPTCVSRNFDIENNVAKYISGAAIEIILAGGTVKGNTVVMPQGNMTLDAGGVLVDSNTVISNSTQDYTSYYGVEELPSGNGNTINNNQTTGICFVNGQLQNPPCGPNGPGPQVPVWIPSGHTSTQSGNTMIARPAWCTDHVCGY